MRIRETAIATALLTAALGWAGCGEGGGTPVAPSTPLPPPLARFTRGPYLQSASEGSVTVAWYQDVAIESRLEWRIEGGAWQETASTAGASLRYEAVLSGLQPQSRYSYRVRGGAGGPMPDTKGRAEFSFRTPRPDVVKLAFMGDTGSGEPSQHAVAARLGMEDPPPDGVVIVGDVVYPHGEDAGYDGQFFAPYGPLLSAIPFYAVLGNHDCEASGGAPLLAVFTLPRNCPSSLAPERAYWFERAGVLTIVHDTNLPTASLRDVALPWHATIARRSAVFRLAVLHHPPFSSGPNAKDPPTPTIKALFPPALSASGVDLALSGHEHFYERTRPIDGVVYVVTGNGGYELYPRGTVNAFTAAFDNTVHGYTVVEVQGRQLTLRHTAADGRQVDTLVLSKPLAATDPVEVLAARAPGEAPRVRATFRVERPWLAETVTLRLLGEGTVAAALNGAPLAFAEGRQESDGFAVFEVSPGRVLPGRNELEIETRGAAGRAPRAPVAEIVVLERAVP
jgi:3',5'-cyclic AMP phosphodiesterase CpdA